MDVFAVGLASSIQECLLDCCELLILVVPAQDSLEMIAIIDARPVQSNVWIKAEEEDDLEGLEG